MKRRFWGVLLIALISVPLIIPAAGCSVIPAGQQDLLTDSGNLSSMATPSSIGSGLAAPPDTIIAGSNNGFAHDLYLQLAHDPQNAGSNILFSPFSISSAFAITYEGARGTTAGEIRTVFHFPADSATLREGFSLINAGINSGDMNYTLSTANALWAEKTYPFMPDYISTAGRWYSANVTNLDFTGQPEASRQTINNWVADRTQDKIQNLLPAGSIGALTRLVITNAVYFKGTWQQQFDPDQTTDTPFRTSDGRTITVRMMQRTDEHAIFPYAETADLQMLSMPYSASGGNGLSMVVLLPKGDDITVAEPYLNPANLSALEQSAVSQQVKVYFPKFTLEAGYDLPATLSALGMPTAFSPSADFSGMDGAHDLFISDVIHKVYLDVNEEGTEAAAATAVEMMAGAAPGGPHEAPVIPVFRADHPFLLVIQDNNSGAILFAGRIMVPSSATSVPSPVPSGTQPALLPLSVPAGLTGMVILAIVGLIVWYCWIRRRKPGTGVSPDTK
jgi:serpin B